MIAVDGMTQDALLACEWRSSEEDVVSVHDGRMDALTAGTATVSCVVADTTVFTVDVTVVQSLVSLTLPSALSVIEEEAFMGATGMTRIALGAKTTQIGSRAFAQIPALKQAELPASVQTIADNAFEGSDSVVVLCEEDSCAQAFCKANEMEYLVIAE